MNVTLDDQAISAFAEEIAASIENVSLTYIVDGSGSIVWQQRFQSGAPDPEECLQEQTAPLAEPRKRVVGSGNFAYDFPLVQDLQVNYVFTAVVYTLDPPSLSYVSMRTAEMLKCVARQIDVDATLTAKALSASQVFESEKLSQALEHMSVSTPVDTSLQDILDIFYEENTVQCVAAFVSSDQTMAVSGDGTIENDSLRNLFAKLRKPLELKRKIVTAQITLTTGQERRVTCAPILCRKSSIDGMILVIAKELESSHSMTVRLVATKVASLIKSQSSNVDLLSRFDLVATADNVLSQQPTLLHSLIYFDSDKTHAINDAFGYSGGDRALGTLRSILVDSAGANDAVAYLGGDRFSMFLPGASGDTAVAKASQILQLLSQEAIEDGNKSINLSASAGVVDSGAAKGGVEDMLILAEVAARGAQDRGGAQCALYQDIDSSIIQRRSDVDKVGFLQMALLENRFVLHAQRIAAINADSTQKFELLARLDDENHPDSSPAQFLSAAERYQLMSALDRWVINSALTSIAGAENALEVSLTTFCINVSAQTLQDDSFIDFIEARIAETRVSPDTLCFELTETSLVRHIDRAQKFVHRLQRLGCQVALDDFGTGYSSFSYLKTLPVNYLKIDGSFVRDLLENELSKTIVQSVANIAGVIGAQTVAEHVENPMVQAWLKNAGIHYVQGFAVHRPEPLLDVLDRIDANSVFEEESVSIDLRGDDSRADIAVS